MSISTNAVRDFFISRSAPFEDLLQPPILFFPCKTFNSWRDILIAMADPVAADFRDGAEAAQRSDVNSLLAEIDKFLNERHTKYSKDAVALAICTLTKSVLRVT